MSHLSEMRLSELIRPQGYACACGRVHACPLKFLEIGRGVIVHVPEMVRALGCRRPFLVADRNTWTAAGAQVDALLTEADIPHANYVIPGERISPAEWEVGSALMHFDPSCDLILAVGSGVVNDICKVLGHATGRPGAVVGTAPSMDGYASNSSSMEVDHVKVSLYNRAPQGILLDADILARAPMRMLQAGLGDMVAKYVALCEWRISNLVTGEFYCEEIACLMRGALKRIVEASEGIARRDPDAIAAIAEGLVLAGIAMAYAEISRPASGLEHYFSHMWEMMALERGKPYDLHGIQVGVGTLLTLKLYRHLRAESPDIEAARAQRAAFSPAAWEEQVRRIFGKTAEEVLAIERRAHKNDAEKHARRLEAICAHWQEILRIMDEELPDYDWLHKTMAATGMPLTPGAISLPVEDAVDAFLGSRDIRDKYLTSSLIWDLGLTEKYAGIVARECET